jgi:hypothetical protein
LLATTLPNVIYNRISSFSNIYYPASCTNSYVNIYLSPTGSDVTGDGSATYPFKTIARALRLMKGVLLNSMDNIIYLNFADGDYSGNLNDYINFNGNIYIGKTGSGTVILPPLDIEGHCIITFTGNFTIKNNASNTTHLQSRSGAIVKSVDSITLTFVFTISGRGLYSTEGDINLGKIICDNTGGYSGITAIYKNGAGMISVSELNSIGTNITTCCYSKRGVIALATNTALYNSTYLTEGGGRVYTGAQSSSGAY